MYAYWHAVHWNRVNDCETAVGDHRIDCYTRSRIASCLFHPVSNSTYFTVHPLVQEDNAKVEHWEAHGNPDTMSGRNAGAHWGYLAALLKSSGTGFITGSTVSVADCALFDLTDNYMRTFADSMRSQVCCDCAVPRAARTVGTYARAGSGLLLMPVWVWRHFLFPCRSSVAVPSSVCLLRVIPSLLCPLVVCLAVSP